MTSAEPASSSNLTRLVSLGVGLVAVLSQAACSVDGIAYGDAVATDQTTKALTVGELLSVNGTYGALCSNRTGAWSLEIAANAPIDNTALSVDLNDAACVLTLTSVNTSAGTILADPAIVLTASYQATASSFGTPVEFYASRSTACWSGGPTPTTSSSRSSERPI